MIIDKLGLDVDFTNQYKKLYTKYGEKMMELEGITDNQLQPMSVFKNISESSNVANASIDSSANVSNKDVNTLQNEAVKPLWKIFSHNKIYSEMRDVFGKNTADKWLDEQVNGGLYLHDSTSASFKSYCFSYSLEDVANKGLFFLSQMRGGRAKHLDTWINHVCEFVSYASQMTSGAVAIPDAILRMHKFWVDDVNSRYIAKENAEKYKLQQFQSFIFRLNQPATRNNIEPAYTNVQILDRPHLEAYFGSLEYNDGTFAIDYFDDFIEFQKDFLHFATELRKKKFYTFPVQTASLKVDENRDYEDEYVAKYVVEANMAFQETNIYNAKEITGISSCCRLINKSKDFEELEEIKTGQFFSSIGNVSISTGSIKVSTLNLARVAYESNGDIFKFYEKLRKKIQLNHKLLKIQRDIITKNIERGMLDIYKHGLIDIKKQFSTNGLSAVFEAIKYLDGISENNIGEKFYNEKGKEILSEVLNIFTEENKLGKDKYDIVFNTEQTPAEQCAIKLVSKDKLLYDNKVVNSTKIYGNQFIPLDVRCSLEERINISSKYDQLLDGGSIGHFNIGEPIKDFDTAWKLVTSITKKGAVYYSLIQKFQYCKNDHTFYGNMCKYCGEPSIGNGIKINGYIVKDEYFHDVRKEELDNRVFYDL